jgi:uncharacterized protein YktA (UPF0223 family)
MKYNFSTGSKYFIDSIKNKKEKEKLAPFLKNFEMSSVLSEFNDAILAFPFDVEEHKEDLERLYKYVRQVVLSKLSQKLLVSSYYKEEKESTDAISMLVDRLAKQEEGTVSTAKKIIFELQE